MPRRGQPGHSHRLVAERLSSGTAMAIAVNDYLSVMRTPRPGGRRP